MNDISIWRVDPVNRRWTKQAINASPQALVPIGDRKLTFVPWMHDGKRHVALLGPADTDLRVDGRMSLGGLALLEGRTEIALAGERLYFVDDVRHEITTHRRSPDQKPLRCAVCRVEFCAGDDVFRCGQCGREYHHQIASPDRPEKLCSQFRDTCLCGAMLSLDPAAEQWRPDAEESEHV